MTQTSVKVREAALKLTLYLCRQKAAEPIKLDSGHTKAPPRFIWPATQRPLYLVR